jgi:RimJ/RimL family protein N-acetyltransferase
MAGFMPTREGEEKTYRVVYAVHRVPQETKDPIEDDLSPKRPDEAAAEFIGLVTLKSLNDRSIALPDDLNLSASAATTALVLELGYMFLPGAWGKGYATESVKSVLETCKRGHSFWTPFSKVYVRAIVCQRNPASLRVMEKTGMTRKGVFHFSGDSIFIGGEWRDHDDLHIFYMYLIE